MTTIRHCTPQGTSPRASSLPFAALAALAALPAAVDAHAFLARPVPRNLAASGHPTTTFEPQSLGLNGPDRNAVHGICGDKPGGPQHYAAPGPVPAGSTFVENDSVEFEFRMTAHHLGFIELELCDSVDITEECFARHRLIRDVPECRGAEGAADPHCRVAWKPATESELGGFTVAGGAAYPNGAPYIAGGPSSNTFGANFVAAYRLPEGVSCSHCVLRWHYFTTNSCAGPASGSEEFWNCADISIAPAAEGGAQAAAPSAAALAEISGRLVAAQPTAVDNEARGNLGCGTFGRNFGNSFVNVGRNSGDYARPAADVLGCANQPDAGTQGCLFEGGAVGRSVALWGGGSDGGSEDPPRTSSAPPQTAAPPTAVCRGVRRSLDGWCAAVGRADPTCSAYPSHCVLESAAPTAGATAVTETTARPTTTTVAETDTQALVCRGVRRSLDGWCAAVGRADPTCSAYPAHCALEPAARRRRTVVLRGRQVQV